MYRNGTQLDDSKMDEEESKKRRNQSSGTPGTGDSGPAGQKGKNGRGSKGKEPTNKNKGTPRSPGDKVERGNRTEKSKSNDEWGQKWDGETVDGYDGADSKATKGYGQPSSGNYSQDMGGYKTFGTQGQGDSNVGVKEDYAETCSDRVMLITVSAQKDTVAAA